MQLRINDKKNKRLVHLSILSFIMWQMQLTNLIYTTNAQTDMQTDNYYVFASKKRTTTNNKTHCAPFNINIFLNLTHLEHVLLCFSITYSFIGTLK